MNIVLISVLAYLRCAMAWIRHCSTRLIVIVEVDVTEFIQLLLKIELDVFAVASALLKLEFDDARALMLLLTTGYASSSKVVC